MCKYCSNTKTTKKTHKLESQVLLSTLNWDSLYIMVKFNGIHNDFNLNWVRTSDIEFTSQNLSFEGL